MSYVPPPTPTAPPVHGPIPNHLAWAIVSTVFSVCLCCGVPGLFTGIAAIVFAAMVNSKLRAGDIAGARKASDTAKILCWITTVLAVLGILWAIYSFTLGDGMAQFQEAMEQIEQAK